MCGIFGIISQNKINNKDLLFLSQHAKQRGRDASGLLNFDGDKYSIFRSDYEVDKLLNNTNLGDNNLTLGHSRLITNGLEDNQPVFSNNLCIFHNGIIVNDEEIWQKLNTQKKLKIDTEVIAGIATDALDQKICFENIVPIILNSCKGVVACAIANLNLGKLCLFSNNGSLYLGKKLGAYYFSSEKFPLLKLKCDNIRQIRKAVFIDIPKISGETNIINKKKIRKNLLPSLGKSLQEEKY